MSRVLDAFVRAAGYCLMPRVILLSLLPLLLLVLSSSVLTWLYWEEAVAWVRQTLELSALLGAALRWLESVGAAGLKAVLAPLLLVAVVVPVMVVVCLLVVSLLMTPALVNLVARRRFAGLQQRRGSPWWWSGLRSFGLSVAAVAVLLASVPLWFVPPLMLVIPPLVWGWLTMQVMGFDVLAEHAEPQERLAVMRAHRWPLMVMGVVSGVLGSAPAAIWALGALTLVLAPLVMVVSVWIYTLVFAFTSLWFAHYLLHGLQEHRLAASVAAPTLESESAS